MKHLIYGSHQVDHHEAMLTDRLPAHHGELVVLVRVLAEKDQLAVGYRAPVRDVKAEDLAIEVDDLVEWLPTPLASWPPSVKS